MIPGMVHASDISNKNRMNRPVSGKRELHGKAFSLFEFSYIIKYAMFYTLFNLSKYILPIDFNILCYCILIEIIHATR